MITYLGVGSNLTLGEALSNFEKTLGEDLEKLTPDVKTVSESGI